VHQPLVVKDRKWARLPFMPSESIPVAVMSDSSPAWLGTCRGLLDGWFDGRRTGGDWEKKKAAGETLLTVMQNLPVDEDSPMATLGYQLADVARFVGHCAEVLTTCESILARHPSGMLAEDLSAELPQFYHMTQRRQTADSLVRVFVSRYPQNAAALSYDEGRGLWYGRTPVPPTWYRHRRLFWVYVLLGVGGGKRSPFDCLLGQVNRSTPQVWVSECRFRRLCLSLSRVLAANSSGTVLRSAHGGQRARRL
jgi:hypothetical protein